ncbi:unnamed protein product [Auanema sp. JU1783]|nr:unnamed protein product [Auanema sp. JU1783]
MAQNDTLFHFEGKVVTGFGRGGKDLGCPTANMDDNVVSNLNPSISCGVYYGYGRVNNGQVYDVVLSIGWNPHFKNEKRTVEVHFIHNFDNDFYGANVECLVVGRIRDMRSFSGLDELKKEIENDITTAKVECGKVENMNKIVDFFASRRNHL